MMELDEHGYGDEQVHIRGLILLDAGSLVSDLVVLLTTEWYVYISRKYLYILFNHCYTIYSTYIHIISFQKLQVHL